jgi:adenylate cyclase
MSSVRQHTILIVDDAPENLQVLGEVLEPHYRVRVATGGERALKISFSDDPPDLILLDVMMPGMSGYEVCRRLKGNPNTQSIPVIFVSAMNEIEDEQKGLALGAVDYLTKPIRAAIVKARVATHLALYDKTRQLERAIVQLEEQALELETLNRTLERRVQEGVAELDRLARLKRFFSPAVAELIVSGQAEDPLRSRRREIVVVFLDLRGFTAFSETADPEEVMGVLSEYHAQMGEMVMEQGGTIERFAGCAADPRPGPKRSAPRPQARRNA